MPVMLKSIACCSVAVACFTLCGTLEAQQPAPADGETYTPGTFPAPYYGGGRGYYGGYGGYGGFGGWGMGWGAGSTAAGSYLTGMGNAIRSQGQYNLDTSAAAINLEEARKRDYENQKLWTQTYFEKRRINQAYQDSQKRPPLSQEAWVRLAQEKAPARLGPSELNPVTGEIRWPPGLMDQIYEVDRTKLDQAFAGWAEAHGAIGVTAHAQIRDAVDSMQNVLKAHIRDYETNQYVRSKNFLTSLAYEATLPAPESPTASR